LISTKNSAKDSCRFISLWRQFNL